MGDRDSYLFTGPPLFTSSLLAALFWPVVGARGGASKFLLPQFGTFCIARGCLGVEKAKKYMAMERMCL